MQNIQTLIDLLEKGRNLHISILDLNGILGTPDTKIDFSHAIHSKKFCDIAKSTERGYRACLYSKLLANTRAIEGCSSFCGQCIFGLYEAALPVVIDKNVAAVIYVGNAVADYGKTVKRIEKACSYTGVTKEALFEELNNCEKIDNSEELFEIAEIVSDYLKLLLRNAPKPKNELHWLVSLMKLYADEKFCENITLRELAATYHMNEKYIGRLFSKEMGVSFTEYCNSLRLQKAEELLRLEDVKIIDVSLDCGFNNVSYFNRIFKKKHGVSPSEYKDKNKASATQ